MEREKINPKDARTKIEGITGLAPPCTNWEIWKNDEIVQFSIKTT
jgi:hypothetical protein